MKSSLFTRPVAALAALACLATASVSSAQDLTPPILLNPPARVKVAAGTLRANVPLADVFGLSGINDQVVRFSTALGDIDVLMDSTDAPGNVANFLSYVDAGSYTNSFLHRSVQQTGLAIVQGGGYYVLDNQVTTIATNPPVANEFAVSNTRGTIAMAKTSDPNSATSEWFFNVQDNSVALDDPQNSGGFTVFGSVVGNGLAVMDALAALQIINAGSPFDQLPVLDSYQGGDVQLTDLAFVYQIARVPLLPATPGGPSLLKLRVRTNTNPNLVTTTISSHILHLSFVAGAKGRAVITVAARDTAGTAVTATVNVLVQ